MKGFIRFFPFVSLFALLPLELFLSYDTVTRRLALMVTCLAVLAALVIFSRTRSSKNSQTLSTTIFWLAGIGVWCDAVGNFLHYYDRFTWWDQLAHGVGTSALALGILLILGFAERANTLRLGPFLRSVFAIALAVTCSALYEVSEYLGDQLFATYRITDLYDTADDLLWNFLASVVVVATITVFDERKKNR